MTIRHRTTFPGRVDFDGWWIKSPKGTVAQLRRAGRDISRNVREQNVYQLLFIANRQEGDGYWTVEELLEAGAVIRVDKEMLSHPTDGCMTELVRARAARRATPKEAPDAPTPD